MKWDQVLAKYGPVAVIALFLTWWVANDVTGQIRDLTGAVNHHVSETQFYLHAICVNVADDESERASCRR